MADRSLAEVLNNEACWSEEDGPNADITPLLVFALQKRVRVLTDPKFVETMSRSGIPLVSGEADSVVSLLARRIQNRG